MNQGRPIAWRKSSASAQGNCVEVAAAAGAVLVRDTKNRDGAVLTFTQSEWSAFLTGAANGEFSLQSLQQGN